MNYKNVAEENYLRFSKIEGNQYIATEYALKTILRLIAQFNVKSILELGLGIGSISDTVLKYAGQNQLDIYYAGTEANEFCLASLPKNVQAYDKIHLYNYLSGVPKDRKFDMIIIDGSEEALRSIEAFTSPKTVIFIEGLRSSQQTILKEVFPKSIKVEIISNSKNPACGPADPALWAGGGQLIFADPSLYQKLTVFKERVATFLKRRQRKLK